MDSGGWLGAIWNFFTPPDPPVSDLFTDPTIIVKAEKHMKAMRWWRVRVSGSLFAITLALIWSVSPWGFVFARDMDEKVTTSVQNAVKEIAAEQGKIKQDISEIKVQNSQMASVLRDIQRASTVAALCRTLNRRVSDQSEVNQRRTDADTEQDKYKALTGEFYPESRCGSGL